jgi:hypothetical protein
LRLRSCGSEVSFGRKLHFSALARLRRRVSGASWLRGATVLLPDSEHETHDIHVRRGGTVVKGAEKDEFALDRTEMARRGQACSPLLVSAAEVTSKRGPSTASRARKNRGKDKTARDSAQDDGAKRPVKAKTRENPHPVKAG